MYKATLSIGALVALVSCGSDDDGSSGDAGQGGARTQTSSGTGGGESGGAAGDASESIGSSAVGGSRGGNGNSSGGGAGGAGEAGAAAALECPDLLELDGQPISVDTQRAAWLEHYLTGVDVRIFALTGAADDGFFVSGRIVGNNDEVTRFGDIDLADRPGMQLGFIAHVNGDGSVAWAHPVLPTPALESSDQWHPPELGLVVGSGGVYLVGALPSSDADERHDFSLEGTTLAAGSADALIVGQISAQGSLEFLRSEGDFEVTGTPLYAGDGLGRLLVAAKYPGGTDDLDCDVVLTIFEGSASRVERCVTQLPDSYVALDGLAGGPDGEVFISGFPGTTYDVGLGIREIVNSGGASVLVKLDSDGEPLWSQEFLRSYARGLSVDSTGNLITTGDVPGFREDSSARFAGAEYSCEETYRHHLTKLGPDGSHLFTRRYRSHENRVTADAEGNLLFSVAGDGEVVPGVPHHAGGALLKLDADARPIWLQALEPSFEDTYRSSGWTVDGSGRVFSFGLLRGSAEIDSDEPVDVGEFLSDLFMGWD